MSRIIFILCSAWVLSACVAGYSGQDISEGWVLYGSQFIRSEANISELEPDTEISLTIRDAIFRNRLGAYGSLLQTINVEPGRSYSLHVPKIYSASRIWIDGELFREYGSLGTSVSTSRAYYREDVIPFTPWSNSTEIVIEFANFDYPHKSALGWIYVGETPEIQQRYMLGMSIDYLVLGCLVICFILFMLLYMVNLSNKYNLYMSLFTLCSAVYVTTNSNIYFAELFSRLDISYMYQLNNVSSVWIFGCILLFFKNLYPSEFNNRRTRYVLYAAVAISVLVFMPVPVFNALRLPFLFTLYIGVSGLTIVFSLVLASKMKRSLSLMLLLLFCVYWAALLIELLWGVPSSLLLLLLIIGMFVLIAIKIAETSRAIEEKQELNTRIRSVFTQFVPLNILDSLGNSALADRPPGEYSTQDCTMMLLDIREFTKMSEGLSAEDSFVMINNFYDIVGYEVDNHNGFIESYGGDGVKAIFAGAADDAAACALTISKRVSETSGIKVGMALHYGKVIFGTIGSEDRIQATAVSDVFRVLSAIDHFESKMGVEIVMTSNVRSQLQHGREELFLGAIILKDHNKPVDLYQIIPASLSLEADFAVLFKTGVRLVQKHDYRNALDSFEKAQQIRHSHLLTACYIRQLKNHITAGDGQFVLKL